MKGAHTADARHPTPTSAPTSLSLGRDAWRMCQTELKRGQDLWTGKFMPLLHFPQPLQIHTHTHRSNRGLFMCSSSSLSILVATRPQVWNFLYLPEGGGSGDAAISLTFLTWCGIFRTAARGGALRPPPLTQPVMLT